MLLIYVKPLITDRMHDHIMLEAIFTPWIFIWLLNFMDKLLPHIYIYLLIPLENEFQKITHALS